MSKKEYKIVETDLTIVSEDADVYEVMSILRTGISFSAFLQTVKESFLDMKEWSKILHIDSRTLQRYKVSNLTFAPLQSEKILEISILHRLGKGIFGDKDKFNKWLRADNISLGNIKPVDMLDNTFGIALVRDELYRIQYGILA